MNETISTRRNPSSRDIALRRERFYPRDRRTVPAARRFARAALDDWGLGAHERSADVALCVSELATNALRHGVPPGRGYQLHLSYAKGVLRVEVHDSGGGVPRLGGAGDGEGGRGLLLVAACADRWGVGERGAPGKAVWCEFDVVPPVPG
ncbi:ATP-binding protein [Streptomyces sp. KL116D]|uniref:ATP-binding protein n=1 Tax=Streptomyces sp. KL116D TaxID=3045152 RepID=UPI003558DF71